jgi:hypothetical protein
MHNQTEFRIGNYRPIYLWAGPGTIRMNKLKFMQVDVDEDVHLSAHKQGGADLVVNKLYQNWIHLTYSWGFPPEIEEEDWVSFGQAVNEYHQQGSKVFAYIQSSNCVFSGSFQKKNWYAITPKGKKVYYYSGRYMTCFQNTDWIHYLQERISDAIYRGADGIFFDNLWYGQQPNPLFKTWLGAPGCYCESCKQIYKLETGKIIPANTDLKKQEVKDYINWRAEKMSSIIENLSNYARSLKPDVIISANDYDPVMRPTKLIFGIDFAALVKIQDVTMIENFALPKWDEAHEILVNNAITIRNTQPYLPDHRHLSVLSYDAGIGFDPVYPIRRILTGMAEAAALGCSMTTKGTEYHDGVKMTLLTAPEYDEQQHAIGKFHHWLEDHQSIYQCQTNRLASVGVLHPGDKLWQNWFQLAPLFFACQQSLLSAGIPWRVVTNLKDLQGIQQLLIFDNQENTEQIDKNIKIIYPTKFSSYPKFSESIFDRSPILKSILVDLADGLIRGYHGSKSMRNVMDWIGMAKLVTHTPFFKSPDKKFQNELLSKLDDNQIIRITSDHPVLIDVWETPNQEVNIHLVNYHIQPQNIRVNIPECSTIELISPFEPDKEFSSNSSQISFDIDIYSICTIKPLQEPK